MTDYVVRQNDTFLNIAQAFGISVSLLRSANPTITDLSRFIGQVIHIPDNQMRRIIEVNGYAFPDIDGQVLVDTLPYLTYLSIFSYRIKPNGSLAGIDDTALIQTARKAHVAPLMVITNTNEDDMFSAEVAHDILTDEALQKTILNNIVGILKLKNYYGLNVDFENIYPTDREAYSRFYQSATAILHPLGYTVAASVALRLKTGESGILYDIHEFPALGNLVNQVIMIVTYEWGQTYGPPMPIAPIDELRHVLDYAVSVIPSQRILMGMTNYGFDWTLPYIPSTAAKMLAFTQAEAIAARTGATIRFDTSSQSPYFYYEDDMGITHMVWFDNELSIRVHLELVDTYNLGGVSFWTINLFSPASYQTLTSLYDVRKVLTL